MLNLEHLVYHNTGDPEPGQLTLMRPFGPALGHTRLPDEIIDAFNPWPDHDDSTELAKSELPVFIAIDIFRHAA